MEVNVKMILQIIRKYGEILVCGEPLITSTFVDAKGTISEQLLHIDGTATEIEDLRSLGLRDGVSLGRIP